MLETPIKTHFPLLPFYKEIPYLEIKPNNLSFNLFNQISSKVLNDPNEAEFEEKCNAKYPEMNFLNTPSTNNDNNFILESYQYHSLHKKKSPVKMSEKASDFKFAFYQIFTTRKKFPKKYVVLIHNEICGYLDIRRVTRDETRSINLYFANFAKHHEKILYYIKKNKNLIIESIPELKEILN